MAASSEESLDSDAERMVYENKEASKSICVLKLSCVARP